ncbi:MAG: hypothetical protein HYZ44_17695 [Bacteroidetes bacterium]|nr:hypothetical protein [Bacteroidota bacterium]
MNLKYTLFLITSVTIFSCNESINPPSKIQDLRGDFNGDQFPDRASVLDDRMTVDLNNKNGGFDSFVWIVSNDWGSPEWTVVGDFDGDGDDDIASPSGSNLYLKNSFRTGFSSHVYRTSDLYSSTGGWTFACDYNGDGVDDIISIEKDKIYIVQPKITSAGEIDNFSTHFHFTINQWSASPKGTWIEDTNGDGRDEIVTVINNVIYCREWDGTNFLMRPKTN